MIAAAKIAYLQERIGRYDDQLAYKELFISFYDPLLLFAFSFLKSKEQAEEVVSDLFLKIWEKRKRIESISNLKVYLYVSTKNIALHYLVKQNRQVSTDFDTVSIDISSIALNPEQLMITAEMLTRIKEAIESLPPKCKMIFKLIKEDELKYKEVAEVLNVSVKTIESQITIALKKIGAAVSFDIKRSVNASQSSSR